MGNVASSWALSTDATTRSHEPRCPIGLSVQVRARQRPPLTWSWNCHRTWKVSSNAAMAASRSSCDPVRVGDSGSRIIPSDELVDDDRSALAWAASTEHPVAVAIAVRVRSGAHPNATVAELAAIRHDWDAGGRPPPKPHVHRTPVRFADGTTVMGVRFLGDDPYVRDDAPAFGLYLDQRWAPPWPHEHLDWPDFGVPDDLDVLRRALTDLLAVPARVSESRSDASAATAEPGPHSPALPS